MESRFSRKGKLYDLLDPERKKIYNTPILLQNRQGFGYLVRLHYPRIIKSSQLKRVEGDDPLISPTNETSYEVYQASTRQCKVFVTYSKI
jgi:hypothetical protein